MNGLTFGTRLASLAGLCIGTVALAGWLGSWPLLKSMLPGTIEMKANTALGLMAAALGLLMLEQAGAAWRRTGQLLALLVTALGLATLAQYLFGWNAGIDELFFNDPDSRYNAFRGRMSPYSALAFTSLGLALLMLNHAGLKTMTTLTAALTLAIGSVSALGYAWNASELITDVFLPPVALNTAIALVFLAVATLLALRQRSDQEAALPFSLRSMEGKIAAGFAASLLLLAIGAGATYKATTVFATSAQQVAHAQQVRATLGRLYGDMSDAGLAQRHYLITGKAQRLGEYQDRLDKVSDQVEQLRLLVSDNDRQTDSIALLEPLIEQTRQLLDQGIALYQTRGFSAAKALVDSGRSQEAMRSLFAVIQRMEGVEQALLIEREANSNRFQRYMLLSMLLTVVVAACIFVALYRGIRLEIQERQRASQDLASARDAAVQLRLDADAANRAKSSFLATMSHEIRTPMNGMLGMLELLSLSPLDGAQHTTLKVIRESSRSLMRIIDDILDFSKMEALKLEIQPEVTCVKSLVQDFHSLYAGNASSKGLVITCRVDQNLSPALLVDPIRLRQILNNLVSNAVKFTSRGQIDISADMMVREPLLEHVRFSVKDTGIGISQEQQQRLFEPFAQAESSTTRRFGGSGLGLTICRRLAGLMGGTIRMDSTPGVGTTMVLELPLPIADTALLAKADTTRGQLVPYLDPDTRRTAPSVAEAEAEATLVLLVDDHPTNRTVLLRQVNLLGYAAKCASNGVEALQLLESGQFSLLLTDCNMPEMDGYELARTVRAREAQQGSQRLPIIACTANALSGEVEVCVSAGMDDYLAKPVELQQLLTKLTRWLPLPPAASVNTHAAEAQAEIPIDYGALARVSGGDAVVERAVFAEFQHANDRDIGLLAQAVAASDRPEVRRLAHLIKGASAMVGALRLAAQCEALEQASAHESLQALQAGLQAVQHELAALNRYFTSLAVLPAAG